jgi:hypothetical protein
MSEMERPRIRLLRVAAVIAAFTLWSAVALAQSPLTRDTAGSVIRAAFGEVKVSAVGQFDHPRLHSSRSFENDR